MNFVRRWLLRRRLAREAVATWRAYHHRRRELLRQAGAEEWRRGLRR